MDQELQAELDLAKKRILQLENEMRQLRSEVDMSPYERMSRKARRETGKIIGLGFHDSIPSDDPGWDKYNAL